MTARKPKPSVVQSIREPSPIAAEIQALAARAIAAGARSVVMLVEVESGKDHASFEVMAVPDSCMVRTGGRQILYEMLNPAEGE